MQFEWDFSHWIMTIESLPARFLWFIYAMLIVVIIYPWISLYHFYMPATLNTQPIHATPSKMKRFALTHDLFGPYLPKDSTIKPSSLNIQLVGILYDKHAANASVILKDESQQEKSYTVSSTLPNGAVIKTIKPQYIIVDYLGELQKVTMPELQLPDMVTPNDVLSSPDNR